MAAVCGHQSRWIAPTAASSSSSSSSASEILTRAAHVRARPSLLQLPRSLGWLSLSLSHFLSLFLFFLLIAFKLAVFIGIPPGIASKTMMTRNC